MRATKKVAEVAIAAKMSHWYTVLMQPGLSRVDRDAARRNYRKLIRAHKAIAKQNGWSEEKVG